ncbi:DUF885 family protein [Congregibacter sp.]|jgi:hypothetical protein|uniref:DUF885 family protein n=1 Tax=Congregibacter sp. TaxID=2744308 RepID=UPI0039E3CC06
MKKVAFLLLLMPLGALAQNANLILSPGWADDPPALLPLVEFSRGESDLRNAIHRYVLDREAIERRYEVQYSPTRIERLSLFHQGWRERLRELNFEQLNFEGQIDYIALRNRIDYNIEMLALHEERGKQIAALLPFSSSLGKLQEDRHNRIRVQPRTAAETLDAVADELADLSAKLNTGNAGNDFGPVVASRAASQIEHLSEVLANWNSFYNGYDPMYNFWVPEPYERVMAGLESYRQAINTHLVGVVEGAKAPIIGDPVLAEGLRADLAVEMIPYSADELIRIGEREFAWIEEQFRLVANNMGYGDDWKAALEYTKELAPPPGEKPWRIFKIGDYSENYIENMDIITLPPLAREVWRLAMQTPERQLINPFFTGGEETRVSYPANTMMHKDKRMSMRGNTPHFNFGTVQHELVPGHHMQGFLTQRFNPHRSELSRTPFWGEGWALYWEFVLLKTDFPRNDADRIGMLFWRLHRAARIVFSLNYHLGRWSPQEAIDFLVERVGHERANAEAEVRRTTRDAPLYQIAYMTGALQFQALYDEVMASGKMTPTEFHDAVMQGGRMPVELVRARLLGQPLSADFKSSWRFYGDP